jgi:hypothetical protein
VDTLRYATSTRLTVRYFAALNFTSSNKACIYITNKNILALGDSIAQSLKIHFSDKADDLQDQEFKRQTWIRLF